MARTRNSDRCCRERRKTKNCQVGKKTFDLQTFASRESTLNSHKTWRPPARSTHNAVRVTHTERLVLATVNVKSLKPKELSRSHKYGVDTNSTIDQIDRDMSLHGCHVVGVQESCIKGNVTREQQNFVAYTSGANGKGQLGVEAWVHRSVLKRARVRPELCSHRLLALKIDGKNINLTVIVAHAPPNDSGEQGQRSFWSSLRKTVQVVPPHRSEWTSGNTQEQVHWELSRRHGKREWERATKGTRREDPARSVDIHPHLPANLVEWAGSTPRQTHRLRG